MDDLPPLLAGFLHAVCTISDGAHQEGGTTCTVVRGVGPPPGRRVGSRGQVALLTRFLEQALGGSAPGVPERLARELRRVVRAATGGDLADIRREDVDDGWGAATLTLWWPAGGRLDSVSLHWAVD